MMKRCKYCAEMIRKEALYCIFCHKEAKGISYQRLSIILIILTLGFYGVAHREQIKKAGEGIQSRYKSVVELKDTMMELATTAPNRINNIRRYRQQLHELSLELESLNNAARSGNVPKNMGAADSKEVKGLTRYRHRLSGLFNELGDKKSK